MHYACVFGLIAKKRYKTRLETIDNLIRGLKNTYGLEGFRKSSCSSRFVQKFLQQEAICCPTHGIAECKKGNFLTTLIYPIVY